MTQAFKPVAQSSNTATVATTATRIQFPPLPSQNPAISLVTKQPNQTAFLYKTGSTSVTANSTNAQLIRIGSYDQPTILGVDPSASHMSLIAVGAAADIIITAGSFVSDIATGGNVVNFNWKGAWSSLTAYKNLPTQDLVQYNGATYIAVANNTNS